MMVRPGRAERSEARPNGAPGPTNTGRFQYTGQLWLEDAGVYHYKNRAYHPGLMRFLQADPIGVSGGMNLYAYVGGDPMNLVDPWGLSGEGAEDGGRVEEEDVIVVNGRRYPTKGGGARGLDVPGGGGYSEPLISPELQAVIDAQEGEDNSLQCPEGGHGEFINQRGRNFGRAPGDPLDFMNKFMRHELFRRAHRISFDTDREIGFSFERNNGAIILAQMTWGPARIGIVMGAFPGGSPYLFLHTHGRPSWRPGLSSDDLDVAENIVAVGAAEGSGAAYFAPFGAVRGSRVGRATRIREDSEC